MVYRLDYRRYSLPFRAPVRTAHGVWTTREGLYVRLEDETGAVRFGEAAPIPGFGQETAELDEAACRELGGRFSESDLERIPANLGALRAGLRIALNPSASAVARPYLPVAALLPAGRAALEKLPPLAEAGFRTFKWKVGVGDVADELRMLDDVVAALPPGGRLRLDANGAWERRLAERWMSVAAERPVEHVEQPIAADDRRHDDVMLGLAGDYPTPVGLDEALVGDGDVERWLGRGWPGVFVIKPSLMGDLPAALDQLARSRSRVVFSSALETVVAARVALQAAFAWSGHGESPLALGMGVWPLFRSSDHDGPHAAPFVRAEDVNRLNPEAAWNALS